MQQTIISKIKPYKHRKTKKLSKDAEEQKQMEEREKELLMLRMQESQIKNKAQIQQIRQLSETFQSLSDKIETIKFLLDVKENEEVLNKIQQLDSSKQSLEDLKRGYQKDISEINAEIDGLREKIGADFNVQKMGVGWNLVTL